MNIVAHHAWSVSGAAITMVCPTTTVVVDQGCWTTLTTKIIPMWIAAGFGMEWVTEPCQDGKTKKVYCEVTNRYSRKDANGRWMDVSRIQVDSLQYEKDAEGRFKNRNHSMVYVSELSYYEDRRTFNVLIETLRGFPEEALLFLGDTNPSEQGEDSWIWKYWYEFRVLDRVTDHQKVEQRMMALREFFLEDNPFLSADTVAVQKSSYDEDSELKDRYVHGKWVKSSGRSVFKENFRPGLHVWGEYDTHTNTDPETMVPEENCHELITGWDVGEVNHAMTIAEKLIISDDKGREHSLFKFIDEVVYIGANLSMPDFVEECMEKIRFWETFLGRELYWRNWSDQSAWARRDKISLIYDHQLVYQLSKGKISLQAAAYQGPGSRRQRVVLNKKILHENRQFISRSRCPNLIESYMALPAGKGMVPIELKSRYKHAWDSASYILAGECYDELLRPREDFRMERIPSNVTVVEL